MTDAPTPSTPPTPAPAPAAGDAAPASAPAAAARPEWLPEAHWDPTGNAIKPEFGAHYQQVASAAAKLAERQAAVPEKPDGYKLEVKLPETVNLPEGVKFDPSKDPRTPQLLAVAHELGLTNSDVNRLVTLDAQFALAQHNAETARVAEEKKKLGDNAGARITAATSWLTAQTGDGKTFTADEASEIRAMVGSAAGVTALEKLMAKANGGIPGHVPAPPASPPPQPITDRWYGAQQKAS